MPRILKDLIVFAVLGAIGWYAWDQHLRDRLLGGRAQHDQVIVYTIAECAECRVRISELRTEGVLFTEIRVDLDAHMLERMHESLREGGYRSRLVEFPVVDVHGTMLANNPPIQRIREHLR